MKDDEKLVEKLVGIWDALGPLEELADRLRSIPTFYELALLLAPPTPLWTFPVEGLEPRPGPVWPNSNGKPHDSDQPLNVDDIIAWEHKKLQMTALQWRKIWADAMHELACGTMKS